MIIKLKRKKYALICLLLAVAFVSGCAQKHKEGELDVISSMKMNQDETLTVVANRKQIEDKEDFAKLALLFATSSSDCFISTRLFYEVSFLLH